jgi:hypothetical protein
LLCQSLWVEAAAAESARAAAAEAAAKLLPHLIHARDQLRTLEHAVPVDIAKAAEHSEGSLINFIERYPAVAVAIKLLEHVVDHLAGVAAAESAEGPARAALGRDFSECNVAVAVGVKLREYGCSASQFRFRNAAVAVGVQGLEHGVGAPEAAETAATKPSATIAVLAAGLVLVITTPAAATFLIGRLICRFFIGGVLPRAGALLPRRGAAGGIAGPLIAG